MLDDDRNPDVAPLLQANHYITRFQTEIENSNVEGAIQIYKNVLDLRAENSEVANLTQDIQRSFISYVNSLFKRKFAIGDNEAVESLIPFYKQLKEEQNYPENLIQLNEALNGILNHPWTIENLQNYRKLFVFLLENLELTDDTIDKIHKVRNKFISQFINEFRDHEELKNTCLEFFIDEFRKAITNGEDERVVIFYDIMTCDQGFNDRNNKAFSGAIDNIANVVRSANPLNSLIYLYNQRGETSLMQDKQFISHHFKTSMGSELW